ncbi:biliverdin-producing heme oxygenase [Pseudidiomarina sp. E22-M8]|uniref:biliverdin-producing heme oxygenase n=1 Tax=Pseudidiomarina sp. E22-M8 TaxID=3424768 RepID=UPI00403D497E
MHNLLSALRSGTRDAHHQLDHHPVLAQLLDSDLSVTRYAEVLSMLYPAHVGLEQMLIGYWCEAPVSYELLPRESLLYQDLLQLGRRPEAPRRWPAPQSFSAAIGATYVIEGSRLGGVMLARRIHRQLADAPCSFFAEDGAKHWSGFQNFVVQHQEMIDEGEAVAGAKSCFAGYETAINQGYAAPVES